jgi:group I intron endonuclease
MKTYFIYKWTNDISGKSYIGVTSNIEKRWKKHMYDAQAGSSLPFHRALIKYDVPLWKLSILRKNLTLNEALTEETNCIVEHHSQTPSGYNLTLGGRGLRNHSFSKLHRERLKWTNERRKIVIEKYKNGLHPTKGKPSKLRGTLRPDVKQRFSKNWIVVTPTGDTLNINNLKDFCRSHNLNNGHMTSVSQGKLKSHKGYTCMENKLCSL